ncbi:MAG: hypothetical protein AAFN77_07635 [Planctomycetota bacterium]
MSSKLFTMNCLLITGLLLVSFCSNATANDHAEKVLGDFTKHVTQHKKFDDKAKSAVKAKLKSFADDPQYAVTEGLVLMYPKYGTAIESSDANHVSDAIDALTPMTESEDQFLAADSSFTLARMLMNNERFEEAMPLLENLTGDLGDYSAHRGAAQFYIGVAHAGLLNNQAAIDSFMRFLQFNQDAPERLIVSAWQQVQELQSIKSGQLDDVYQRMDYSRRRLALQETDDQTQEQQDKIVAMLNKLIKEAEKKECSNCKGGKCDKKGQKKPGQKQAQSKPGQSKSKSGSSSSNPNGKAIVKNYDDSPTSSWSRLRERSRDPANNAVKEKLPARYREIVERFIKAANGEDE